MPGTLCAGQAVDDAKNGKIKNSKAFCEGYLARSIEVTPVNPHAAGSEAAVAFAAGAAAKLAGDAPLCCAPCGAAAT